MISFSRRAALVSVSIASLVALSACRDLPKPQHEGVESTQSAQLKERQPLEIAVAPIQNGAGDGVPVDELRISFQKNLVKRHYSPLALEFVDRKVVDAAYTPGSSAEQAVLVVQVDRWDTSLWASHNAIVARLSARLIDASNPGAPALWSGKVVNKRFDFGREATHFSTESARMAWACDQIAGRLLEALPPRQSRPGFGD